MDWTRTNIWALSSDTRGLEYLVFTFFNNQSIITLFFKDFIYLFLERGRHRGKETLMCKRNIHRLPLTHVPTQDLAHNLNMCPGIKVATFWFADHHLIHWADLSVYRPELNPLSHTRQGQKTIRLDHGKKKNQKQNKIKQKKSLEFLSQRKKLYLSISISIYICI